MTEIAEDTPSRSHHDARDGRGMFTRTMDDAQLDAKACELRRDGLTYDAIALQLGLQHRSSARKAVQRGLLAIVQEPAEELRALELERLDVLWSKAMEIMLRKHYVAQMGSVVHLKVGDVRIPLLDDGPNLKAIEVLVKLQERRAKLVGLDSAAKLEVLTVDLIDAEIQRLRATIDVVYEQPAITD